MTSRCITYLSLLAQVQIVIEATEYFVSSADGDDSNPGTLAQPFQHIQKAVGLLKPGDVCSIREGTYIEEVAISGIHGSPGQPITIRAYPGEYVLFDGTAPLSQNWDWYKNDIYVTNVSQDVWQLFVDGEMQVNARWPNALWKDFSVFDYTRWGFSDAKSSFDQVSNTGIMVDNGTQNLAASNLNATNAMAILNIGSWKTWAGVVQEHTPGQNSFKYKTSISKQENVHFVPQHSRYFLEDKLEFLDVPTEWYYDRSSGKLYLWTHSSDTPEKHQIQTKNSTYAITVTGGSAWLNISGLNFFGTTVYIRGNSPKEDVNNIVLDSLHFTYPSYTKRMLGSVSPPNTTTIYYNGPLTQNAGNFTIFNCTWEYADGQTMDYREGDGLIQNNLWHHNDFTCVGNGDLLESGGVRDRFIRNVVHSNGPSVGFHPGSGGNRDRQLNLPLADLVRLNLFYDLKYLQDDGSHVQTVVLAQKDVVLEYNWGYDTLKWGMRFDCGTCNESSDSWGHNGTIRYNVLWRTRGISVKGDYHFIHNNLVYDSHLYADLFLRSNPGSSDGFKNENKHTISTKNILQHGACPARAETKCQYPVPGYFPDNQLGNVREYLRDPDNLDFRPKLNNYLAMNGIGPYGTESLSHGGTYWIPGRQKLTSSSPIPPNGTATAKCDADLMWLAGYEAKAHNVYVGSNKEAVLEAGPFSPEYKGNFKMPSNIFTPGAIQPGASYFWRVDAIIDTHTRRGDVWTFQCQT